MGARERERKRERDKPCYSKRAREKKQQNVPKIFAIIHFNHLLSSLKMSKIASTKVSLITALESVDSSVVNMPLRRR